MDWLSGLGRLASESSEELLILLIRYRLDLRTLSYCLFVVCICPFLAAMVHLLLLLVDSFAYRACVQLGFVNRNVLKVKVVRSPRSYPASSWSSYDLHPPSASCDSRSSRGSHLRMRRPSSQGLVSRQPSFKCGRSWLSLARLQPSCLSSPSIERTTSRYGYWRLRSLLD